MSKELEAMKGIKQAIAEHLHKQTGVSVEKHFEYLQYDTEIEVVTNALNELERLKKFKETFDNYELAKKQDFIAYENWLECEAELKKTPTADEVCNELDKWYIEATGDLLIANINDFTYDKKEKRFYKRMLNKPHQMTVCRLDTNDCVQLREPLPPHLTTMIGKFYESLEEEKHE